MSSFGSFKAVALVVLVATIAMGSITCAWAGDPNGTNTGTAADVTAAKAGSPTLPEVASELGHTKIAVNYVWLLLAGFLVMFMQAGFAMLETGFVRSKNAVHTMMMNLMIYAIGIIGFFLVGFAFMFGGAGPFATLGGGAGLAHELTINLFGKPFGLL
ncbi:MAG: ammonium transporter, partial [Armatimonadota bacterium]